MDLVTYLAEFGFVTGTARVGSSLPEDFSGGTPTKHYPVDGWRVDLARELNSAEEAALDAAMGASLMDWLLSADALSVEAGETLTFSIQVEALLGALPASVSGSLNGAAFTETLDEFGACTLAVTVGSGIESVVMVVEDRRLEVPVV